MRACTCPCFLNNKGIAPREMVIGPLIGHIGQMAASTLSFKPGMITKSAAAPTRRACQVLVCIGVRLQGRTPGALVSPFQQTTSLPAFGWQPLAFICTKLRQCQPATASPCNRPHFEDVVARIDGAVFNVLGSLRHSVRIVRNPKTCPIAPNPHRSSARYCLGQVPRNP